MSGEWEKKVLFNGNNNTTVEGTLVGSPSTTSLYTLMRRCLKKPKQMIAQPLIVMSESHIKAVSNFCAKNRGMLYIYTL